MPGTVAEPNSGSFRRDTNYVSDRITRDGRDGWQVEAGRYRLIAAAACPWANRTMIVRNLLGLGDAISLGLAGPVHDETSWNFHLDPEGVDPVLGIHHLRDAYEARFPAYDRGVTVPAIVEVETGRLVTNDFPSITHDFFFEWADHHRPDAPDLWPEERREEMETVMERVYRTVNNGVYKAGFARDQASYERAYSALFDTLDWLEERLAERRYLLGDQLTEADVRLWTTLARFDAVYHGHFKCNRNKLTEMPNLWRYARDLYQRPEFGSTIDWDQIKAHYFIVHRNLNPNGIVPVGPDPKVWDEPPVVHR